MTRCNRPPGMRISRRRHDGRSPWATNNRPPASPMLLSTVAKNEQAAVQVPGRTYEAQSARKNTMPRCCDAYSLLLLAPMLLATTGRPPLVEGVTRDTCDKRRGTVAVTSIVYFTAVAEASGASRIRGQPRDRTGCLGQNTTRLGSPGNTDRQTQMSYRNKASYDHRNVCIPRDLLCAASCRLLQKINAPDCFAPKPWQSAIA